MEDLKTQSLMKQLLYNPQLQAACPLPFDEAKLWKGQRGPELKQKIQGQFRNIRLCSNPSRLIVDLSYNVDFFLFSNDKTMITKVVFCYQTFIAQNSFLTLYIFWWSTIKPHFCFCFQIYICWSNPSLFVRLIIIIFSGTICLVLKEMR